MQNLCKICWNWFDALPLRVFTTQSKGKQSTKYQWDFRKQWHLQTEVKNYSYYTGKYLSDLLGHKNRQQKNVECWILTFFQVGWELSDTIFNKMNLKQSKRVTIRLRSFWMWNSWKQEDRPMSYENCIL